jgi:hypothetical protein
MLGERGDRGGQRVRQEPVVAVQHVHQLTARPGQPEVAGGGDAELFAVGRVPAEGEPPDHLRELRLRPVLLYHPVELPTVGKLLGGQALTRLDQQIGPV